MSEHLPQTGESGGKTRPQSHPPPRRLGLYLGLGLVLLLGYGAYVHWRQASDARETLDAQRSFVPSVQVATAKLSNGRTDLALPGQTVAFASADLFARATGYISERHVDIGSRVHKGDVLLRIAAPDLDEQLNQARAQLGQMQAALLQATIMLKQAQDNKNLANLNKYRATTLAREGWGTQQTADTNSTTARVSTSSVAGAQAGIAVAVANLRAQQATVDRLVALTGFETVAAPFDGVITRRDVDVGDLVQNGGSSSTPLFHIDRDDILRCEVYVPQSHFAGIRDGLQAAVTVPELPERVFHGTISRTSSALAQNSRSMLVEVDIANPDGALAPGLFVNIALAVERASPVVVIPDAALIFDAGGLQVAVVDAKQHVHLIKVSMLRDLGEQAELRSGLRGGERLVVNVPTNLEDGQRVRTTGGAADRSEAAASKS